MTKANHSVVLRLAMLVFIMLLPLGAAWAEQPPHKRKQADPELSPLAVRLTSMSPAVLPKRGPLQITGTVTNRSDEAWREVSVYPFASSTPITARESLEDAIATEEGVVVGQRFFSTRRSVARIGDLGVGQTVAFHLVIPRKDIPISLERPGVYWIGAHALGADSRGLDSLSDGRARTFIAQVDTRPARAKVALVVPVRANGERTPDGKVAAAKRWADLLGHGGRLDRIRGLVSTAPTNAVNLLIDPAVLDSAADLAGGNQAADLGGTQTNEEAKDEGNDASSETPNDLAANQWLGSMQRLSGVQNNFYAPYADPDVASLARHDRALLRTAKQQGAASMAKHTIHAQPMLAPIDGQFDPKLLGKLGNLPVLLDSATADTEDGLTAPDYATSGKAQLVFADSLLAGGGPDGGPDGANHFDALGLRQLILATASLPQIDAGGETTTTAPTLVVSLPRLWDPGAHWATADFFDGLQQPWLRLVKLPTTNTTKFAGSLDYDPDTEVSQSNVAAAARGSKRARVLSELLSAPNNAERIFTAAALTAVSYDARTHPRVSRRSAGKADDWVGAQLNEITVTGSDFVTLSGGSGPVSVSIVNGLDHPVVVGLKAKTGSSWIKVSVPEPVRLEPKQRASVKVKIDAEAAGVHQIQVSPMTQEGHVLSQPFTFNVRTSQVGKLIWVIMIAGAGLFAVMVVRRIIRRIRTRSWRPSPPAATDWDDEADRGE
ncbi:MAG: hypothetical protein H6530_02345 [Nocardioidaceae bacterium]|nr:hypothetical protein [Nocardioidaceae bacterium]